MSESIGKREIDYVLKIHTVPEDLRDPLPERREYLQSTKDLWEYVIASRLLWRVRDFDEQGTAWIGVNRIDSNGEPKFSSLAIDEECYDKIECDPYEVEDISGLDG